MGSAEYRTGGREARVTLRPRDPEVGDLHPVLVTDHHVSRFDVAVDHAGEVSVSEGLTSLRGDTHCMSRVHRSLLAE